MYRLFAISVMLFGLLIAPAQAHSTLSSIVPANGSTVSAPKELVLTFSNELHLVSVKLTTESAEDITVPVKHDGAPAKSFTLSLPALKPGAYTLRWSASAPDGHVMKGTTTFTVAADKAKP